MKKFLVAMFIVAIPVSAFAFQVNENLMSNITGMETGSSVSRSLKYADAASVQVRLTNYTGSVAVQASCDGGSNYLTLQSYTTPNTTTIYSFTYGVVPSHVRVVATDSFTTKKGRGGVYVDLSYRERR